MASVRSYVAAAAKKEERTFHLSLTFAVSSLGFVLGPILTVSLIGFQNFIMSDVSSVNLHLCFQAAYTPIQCSEKVDLGGSYIALDMYTVPG